MTRREWPTEADPSARNPRSIDEELTRRIEGAQIALLGELDLGAGTDYAGLGWSMYELASFCLETDAVRTQLETASSKQTFSFPAILAVWAVARAQELEDGDELWATAPIAKNKQGLIGPKFREAIQTLGLEDFSDHLRGLQQYVALARMHAIVPTYAVRAFVDHIRRGCERHQHAQVIYQDLLTASDMTVPVRQLLREKPDLGTDLVTRAILTVRRCADSGLPPRLTAALLDQTRGSRYSASRFTEPPIIKLDPTMRQLYLADGRGWTVSANGRAVDANNLPACDLQAESRNGGAVPLLTLTDGYLVFDSTLSLVDGRSIPSAGGYLLWGPEVRFDLALLSAEPDDMLGAWRGWQLAPIHTQQRFEVHLPNGALRFLGIRQTLTVEAQPLRWLQTTDNLPVYGNMPRLAAGLTASVIDHATRARRQLTDGGVIHELVPGPFDVTVYAALGRSIDMKGLYIPGLAIDGSDNSLLPAEHRTVIFTADPGWTLPEPIVVVAGGDPVTVLALGTDGQQYEMLLSPSFITWSIEFVGRAPEYLSTPGNYRYEQLIDLRRIVLHGLSTSDEPRLTVHEANALVMSIPGSRRDADLVFDLRAVAGARRNQRLDLKTELRGKTNTLATFHPRERLTRLDSLSQLKATVLEKGWFTDDEWRQIDAERERESMRLRTMHRMKGWTR